MRPRPSTCFAGAFAMALVLRGLAAQAQPAAPSPSDKALAETFFRDGRALMTAGKTPEACAKFSESQRLDPQIGTELNLALCHEADGKTASAWAEFDEVAEQATRPADKGRGDFARQHAHDLEKKLSRVRLVVAKPGPDMAVKVDGRALSTSVWGTPFPIDPGDHTVEASATGKKPWTQSFRVAPGPSTADLGVPPLEDAGSAAPAVVPAAPPAPVPALQQAPSPGASSPPPPPADAKPSGSGGKTVGFILAGIGVVGIGAGSVFGIMTFSKNGTANDNCKLPGGKCTQAGVDAGNAASTDAAISTVAFGVGVVSLAVGTFMILASRHPAPAAARVRVTPLLGSAGGGLGLSGSW
jgi:hypothetical protein